MLDPYSSCPCGSGKKFKWCCQPIHENIEKALLQQKNGQHEMALKTIDDVVREHPKNPEALGRKAQLLHANGRKEEAEKVLEEAFQINPQYAFGYLVQGLMRLEEQEEQGAIMLFRKAAELYAFDASDQLGFLFEQIGQYEMARNHPVAARYAFSQCVRHQPDNQELRQAFDEAFGESSRTPVAARREYKLLGSEPRRPSVWHDALAKGNSGKLNDAAKAFETFGKESKTEALAWYNAAILRAWLGDNAKALANLDRYVEREADESRAAEAWALGEVLRLGDGMEEQSDYQQHRRMVRYGNPQAVIGLLQEWETAGRLIGARQVAEEGLLTALVLEETSGLIGAAAPTSAGLGAYLMLLGDVLQVWSPNPAGVDKILLEVKTKLGTTILEEKSALGDAQFGDVTIEAMAFPTYGKATPEFIDKAKERAQHYFEEIWAHRSLKSLAGNTPIDAAGHPILRRKLLGDILFLEQNFTGNAPKPAKGSAAETPEFYDFDRLRHKLGVDTAPPPMPIDFTAMSAADLAGLDVGALSIEQLEKAHKAALSLDAGELASRFIRTIIERPVDPNRPDLFPFFKYLIDQSQTRADWESALRLVEEGIKADAERNGGKRQGDYEIRRAQLLAKKGDAQKSAEAFEALIARVPGELKYRGTAAEAMLTLRQGSRALKFAEAGLAEARKQGNRDVEAYLQELVAAAKKQGG